VPPALAHQLAAALLVVPPVLKRRLTAAPPAAPQMLLKEFAGLRRAALSVGRAFETGRALDQHRRDAAGVLR